MCSKNDCDIKKDRGSGLEGLLLAKFEIISIIKYIINNWF